MGSPIGLSHSCLLEGAARSHLASAAAQTRKVETLPGEDQLNFQVLTEHSVDMICCIGLDHTMQYVSPACLRLLGWTQEEMTGVGPETFVVPEDLPLIQAAAGRVGLPGVENAPATVRMRRKDGSLVWMEMNARAVRDPATGEPREVVVVMRDITEYKAMEEKLANMALSDGLTGLANRRAFDQALQREWELTLREGSELSLLLLDIDHFKRFNDSYGHQAGDDCLRTIAAAVKDSVRCTDIAARYGGEEIAVILRPMGAAGARNTAEKLRTAIEVLHLPQQDGWVTASIGVATALARQGGTARMPESLLQAADNALYQAKREGRNRVVNALLMSHQER
jgi:diguanylate cyclase (GGDEF)-like protein/PAS domain S-box-containing protein